MSNSFSFTLEAKRGHARAGLITTPHGRVQTPIFMPVGTQATVKSLDSADLEQLGAEIVLANTYHLYLRPGAARVAQLGGLHRFMNWPHPTLTDSGGFQVFSLDGLIDADGVTFRSHLDGSTHRFTPDTADSLQHQLGADIIMAFDDCTRDIADQHQAAAALDRTSRWAEQSLAAWEKRRRLSAQGSYQALFGIIQGGQHHHLRRLAARSICQLPFDGIALGGETIGYNSAGTVQVMDSVRELLPVDKPHYAMGLGRDPADVVLGVNLGFDMFDCVGPSRLARNGALFAGRLSIEQPAQGQTTANAGAFSFRSPYRRGRLSIARQEFASDRRPIQPDCDCATCQAGYTRAYLHHLYKTKELSYFRLATRHNLRFMVGLTEQMRSALVR